ncbi:MAG: MFS transporter [Rubrobacter sp.]|nr:MFS transporter [Rubrobacter sp.]
MFFANGTVFGNWIARIPDVQEGLGIGEGVLGLALLGAAVGALLAMPAAGWLVSRLGSRPVTAVSAVLFCSFLPLLALAPSAVYLGLALFLFGAGNGLMDVSMNSQAVAVERRYGRSIMASFHAMFSFGGLVGAGMGGLAASLGAELVPHFLGAAAVFVVVVLLVGRWLLPAAEDAAASGPAFARPTRALALLGFVAFCALLAEGAMADWSAVYLRGTLEAGPGMAAAGFAAFSLAMALGRLSGDYFIERFGAVTILRTGGLLAASGLGLSLLAGGPYLALVGFVLVGAGLSTLFPIVLSTASRAPGMTPGAAIASMATTGYFGFLIGPPVIGFAAELVTLRGALALVVVLAAAIALLARSADPRKKL